MPIRLDWSQSLQSSRATAIPNGRCDESARGRSAGSVRN